MSVSISYGSGISKKKKKYFTSSNKPSEEIVSVEVLLSVDSKLV